MVDQEGRASKQKEHVERTSDRLARRMGAKFVDDIGICGGPGQREPLPMRR